MRVVRPEALVCLAQVHVGIGAVFLSVLLIQDPFFFTIGLQQWTHFLFITFELYNALFITSVTKILAYFLSITTK